MEHVLTNSVDSTAAVCLDSKGIDAKQVFVCWFFFKIYFLVLIKMWQNSLKAASTTTARSSIFKVYEASLEVLLSKDTGQITASIKSANVSLLKESIENWPQNTSNLTASNIIIKCGYFDMHAVSSLSSHTSNRYQAGHHFKQPSVQCCITSFLIIS